MYGRMVVTNVVNIGVMAVLARQLTPAEFGLVALASGILQLLTIVGTQGVSQFIIHDHKEGWEERVQAAFWLDVMLSLTCTLVGLALLSAIVRFFEDPTLRPILMVLLLFFPVKSLSKIPDSLLRKTLDFKSLEIRDTFIELFIAIASVGLVLNGFGVWSIVLPGVAGSFIRLLAVFSISDWRPQLTPNFRLWKPIFRYYSSVTGSAAMSYVLNEGDTLLIGKVLGSASLGVYNIAWQSANLVNRTIVGLGNKMALPALASVSHDYNKAHLVLGRIMKVIGSIAFPALIGLAVVADDFILVLYGSQWEGAVLPLRILIIYALRYAVAPPIGAFHQAVGRPQVNFYLNVFIVPFYLGAIWYGSGWGVVGIAAGVTAVRTLFGLISFEIVARFLKVRFMDIVSPLFPPLFASLLMGGVVALFKMQVNLLFDGVHLIELMLLVGLGAVTYVVLLRYAFSDVAYEITKLTAPLLGTHQRVVEAILRTRALGA